MAGLRCKYAAKCISNALEMWRRFLLGIFNSVFCFMLFNDLVSERNLSTAIGQKDDAHHEQYPKVFYEHSHGITYRHSQNS